jgi:rare lipoprotein A
MRPYHGVRLIENDKNHGLLGGLMTFVDVLSSRARRWLSDKATRKCNVAIRFAYGPLLAASVACASTGDAHANASASALSLRSDHAPAAHFASLLAVTKRSTSRKFTSRFDYPPASPIMNVRASSLSLDDIPGSIPDLRFDLSPPKPVFLTSLTPPATVDARIEQSGKLAPEMIVGIASMYNPNDPKDKDAGGRETASGELYDEAGWTAAIRIDLRARFGGVGYGKNYQPAYALVETGNKRAIVKINDVGPLKPGRIIDLNERTMRYFDPTLQLGLINEMRVTALPGTNWTAGPVSAGDETINLAGDFGL